MKSLPLTAFILYLLFSSLTAQAQLYKWVDAEGNISYSDQPPYKGAKTLDVPPLPTVQATDIPKKKPKVTEGTDLETRETTYSYLKITSPENEAYIRDTNGTVSISFAIKPALDVKYGHYFSLNMDGKTVQKKFASNSTQLSNIDRGNHNFSVIVKNKKGKTLRKSKAITVYVHRQSSIQN